MAMNAHNNVATNMTTDIISADRRARANETRRRNAETREAQRQEKAADRVLIVNALRDVLKSPSTTVSQRLQAAQMLAEFMK